MNKGWLIVRPKYLPVSFRLDRRVPLVTLALLLVTLAAAIAHIGWGEYPIPPLEVLKTILGWQTDNPDYNLVINTFRLPRTIVAYVVGVGLAIAGTILQGLTRNPLADPGIVGINAGASLAAVTLIVLMPSAPLFVLPLAAFGGALAVTLSIYLLSWERGNSPLRLILMGIGIAAIADALITLTIAYGQIDRVSEALVWLAGSVYGRDWNHVATLLPWIAILTPLALVMARQLNALSLGDDIARNLGSQLEWQRGCLLLTSVALAGAAVATTGNMGFVGLIAPHLGRQLVGPAHEGLMLTAAMLGGAIVLLADLVGQRLFAPIELPCGVITAAIGAPYFLYLLVKKRST
jgi:iron complex transport system permease protein